MFYVHKKQTSMLWLEQIMKGFTYSIVCNRPSSQLGASRKHMDFLVGKMFCFTNLQRKFSLGLFHFLPLFYFIDLFIFFSGNNSQTIGKSTILTTPGSNFTHPKNDKKCSPYHNGPTSSKKGKMVRFCSLFFLFFLN